MIIILDRTKQTMSFEEKLTHLARMVDAQESKRATQQSELSSRTN
jgi:hypothetical protein